MKRLLALLVICVGSRAASAQVASTDSARAHSGLAVHMPFFVPFFHHRHEAGRARSAEPDSTAVIRIEAGYDGNFRSTELSRDESATVNLDFTPSSRLELQADLDFWAAETPTDEAATRGRGDAHVSVQWTAFTIHPGHIAVALAYIAKLPAASQSQLGTGHVDHRFLTPLSFAFKGIQVDSYAGADANGRDGGGFDWGPEAGVSLTVALGSILSVHGGLSGQTLDTDQPAGGYVSGGFTWQARPLIAVDLGARAGISAGTPRYGLVAGVTAVLVTRKP